MYSQDFEREADYVGMYILANLELKEGYKLLRRMSVENPQINFYASTHPPHQKVVNIEAVNKEIDKKILDQSLCFLREFK